MSAQIPGSLGKEGGNAWMLGRQIKSVHSSSKDHSRKHRRGKDVAHEAKRWILDKDGDQGAGRSSVFKPSYAPY